MKAREVFEIALSLMGEESDSEGAAYNVEGFARSAPGMIGALAVGLDELDCILKGISSDADNRLPNLVCREEDEVGLHELICRSVLPFGLCYLLLLEENPDKSAHFFRLYQSERQALKKRFDRPLRHGIRNIYGAI